jgi:hypothetical protein
MTLAIGVEKVFVGGELVWDGGRPASGRSGDVIGTSGAAGKLRR